MMDNFKLGSKYKANVIFEQSIDVGDKGYLLIYGKHINGYYCCIPNWSVGCEMSSSESTGYNRDKLIECGINEDDAIQLAKAIKLIVTESNS